MATNFPNSIDSFVNPGSTSNLDDPAVVHHVQHANHNDSITALERKLGIDFSSVVTSLDFIANFLILVQVEHPAGGYKEINPQANPFPSQVIWYKDITKTVKLVEKQYVRDANQNPTTISLKLYDGTVSNTVIRTITDTVTYSAPFELSRTRTIV